MALVSDGKCIRGDYARCAMQIDTFTFFRMVTTVVQCMGGFGMPPIQLSCVCSSLLAQGLETKMSGTLSH